MKNNQFIHSSAIIDEGAKIGESTRVWHWSHVCSGASIGSNCSLGQNVFIGNDVIIGNNVKIQNNVSIYDNIRISNDVFCGPSMVFTNVRNPRSAINRKSEYKKTIVLKGVTFGANSTIVCGVEIGAHAFVGAGALINKDVKDFALMVGVPAKQIGWMSKYGERIELPINGNGEWKCPHTNTLYELNNGNMKIKEFQ